MFVSKISSVVRNTLAKAYSNASALSAVQTRLSSTSETAKTTETLPPNVENSSAVATQTNQSQELPDKLYKKIEVEVRGNDPAVLQSYGIFTEMAAHELGITMTQNLAPKKPDHERWSVLKSAHIYKKHQVQYEFRTYYRFLHFIHLTGSTADTLLEYLQRNLPEGVAMKVTKHEVQPIPRQILNS